MESRRHRTAPSARAKKKAKGRIDDAVGTLALPNIAQLIEDGAITIGMLHPVGCVATAADDDCNYATLVRRRGESLFQLLTRLDRAIDRALTLGHFTDEING